MSIASEMTNLAANRDAIKAAIEAKNPTVAPTNALSSFPASIASISGGSSSASPVAAMYGWPDIKALLAADTEDYAHKAYVLFDGAVCPTVPKIMNTSDYSIFTGVAKAVTSDGSVYTSNAAHTWDATKLISGRYGWIAYYSSTGFTSLDIQVSTSAIATMPLWVVGNTALAISSAYENNYTAQNAYGLVAIDFPSIVLASNRGNRSMFGCMSLVEVPPLDISACTNPSVIYADCRSLKSSASLVMSNSAATNTSQMFYNCYSLTDAPSVMDTSKSTNCSYMFSGCAYLRALPDTLDIGISTNNTNVFNGCYSLEVLPTHFTANLSVSFAHSIHVRDKASVATFVNGAITDGFIGNLNTCNKSGQTITLNAAIKGLFTASEQSAIEAAMTAKNWTLSW